MAADQCSATAKSTGERCTRPTVPGARVCRFHGGAAPQVIAAGVSRIVEAEARAAFGRLADHATPVEDPFTALAQVAGEVLAWKEFCAGRIADLTELGTLDDKGAEQTLALVALFERAMDRSVATLTAIAKLGIEDRMARVNERQAEAVVRAVEAGIAAAGIEDRGAMLAVRAAVARELRAAA